MSNLDQISAAIASPSSSLETPVNQLAPAPAQTLISPGCITEETSKKIQLNNTADSQAPETTPSQQQEEIQAATSMFANLVAGGGTSFQYTSDGDSKTYVITDFTSLYNIPSLAIRAIKTTNQHGEPIYSTELLQALGLQSKGKNRYPNKTDFQKQLLINGLDGWYGEKAKKEAKVFADEQGVKLKDNQLVKLEGQELIDAQKRTATSMFASLVAGEGTSVQYTCKGEKKTYVIKDFTSLYNIRSEAILAIRAIKTTNQHGEPIYSTAILQALGLHSKGVRFPNKTDFQKRLLIKGLDGRYGEKAKKEAKVFADEQGVKLKDNQLVKLEGQELIDAQKRTATSMFASLVAGEGTSVQYTYKGEKKTYVIKDFTSLYNIRSEAINAIKITDQNGEVIMSSAKILQALGLKSTGDGQLSKTDFQKKLLIKGLDDWYGESVKEEAKAIADLELKELNDKGDLVALEGEEITLAKKRTHSRRLEEAVGPKKVDIYNLLLKSAKEILNKKEEDSIGFKDLYYLQVVNIQKLKIQLDIQERPHGVSATGNMIHPQHSKCYNLHRLSEFKEFILIEALYGTFGENAQKEAQTLSIELGITLNSCGELVNKESNQTPNVPAPNPKPQNNPADSKNPPTSQDNKPTPPQNNPADSKNPPTSQDSTPTPSPNGNNPHSQQNQPPQPGKHSDLTELPPAYKQGQKRALERLNKVLDNSKSNSNDEDAKKIKAIQTNINSIKGNAFEQLIGVYLAYKYPDQQIIPQYCLVVEEKWCKEAKAMVGYCGMRADFRVGDTIYEIKWGANGSTFSINECVDKHLNAINNLKEKFKYKVLTCVQNTHAKARPMTPFLEEIQRELADDLGAIELFTQLTQALQNIATVKNAELLKHYQNAFYSIFEQTLKKQTQEIKEYIEGIIESLALHSLDDLVGTELLEFLRDNNLQQVPDPFLGNAMIEGKLRQVHVMLPDYLAENADLDDNLTENEDLNENAGQDDNAAPAPAPRPTPAIKPAHHHATSEAAPVGQREDAATEQADPQLTMQLPRQPLSQPWPLSQTIITQLARPPLAKNMQLQSKRANKWNLAPHMSSSSS